MLSGKQDEAPGISAFLNLGSFLEPANLRLQLMDQKQATSGLLTAFSSDG
jgi:hypothetical protein